MSTFDDDAYAEVMEDTDRRFFVSDEEHAELAKTGKTKLKINHMSYIVIDTNGNILESTSILRKFAKGKQIELLHNEGKLKRF